MEENNYLLLIIDPQNDLRDPDGNAREGRKRDAERDEYDRVGRLPYGDVRAWCYR